VGFETQPPGADSLINTDVPVTGTRSLYTRARFSLSPADVDNLSLALDYDDGVVVWLNGGEVYRSPEMPGVAGSTPAWNVQPTEHESSNGAAPNFGTSIDISWAIPFLEEGPNVMALGLYNNETAPGTDLVLVPRLNMNATGLDNCLGVFNPDQANADGDAQGDACDTDDDNDTVLDTAPDNCRTVANLDQANADGDAFGDVCDSCPNDAANDVDNDLVCANAGFAPPKVDDLDNCPTVSNTNQADLDLDGQGDACDTDDDQDTIPDVSDNCRPRPPWAR
jgi:hypothetical protein